MTVPGLDELRVRAREFQWPPLGETQRFLLLSVLIGIFAGLLVVCFHIAIDVVAWITREAAVGRNVLVTLVSPALGALAGFFLISRVFRAAGGSGVSHTKAAVYVSDGHVPGQVVAGKFFACSLTIGTGNSLGPEDPALHMGAGVASVLGRTFRLTREKMRLIAPVGAAASLAAAFNTPITAVLFVIEEVLAGWSAGVLGSIVLSAVSAVVTMRWFLGSQPLFLVPQFDALAHSSELLVYAFIGVAGGLLSVLFVKAIGHLRERLARLPGKSLYLQPAAAGLMVGFIGVWLPQIMGAGYAGIDGALHNRFTWQMLLLLGVAKILATMLCFGARIPGGMFAPTLFTGAMIGGGIGGLAEIYWPFATSAPSAYVLVGMGTFFAGVFRAPMTSIFMVFEVSASYQIILPVMIANTIAYLISRHWQKVPFFTMIGLQEGLELPSVEEQRESPTLRVEDAMSPPPVVVARDVPVAGALEELDHHGCVIAEEGGAWFAIARRELEAAARQGKGALRLADAVSLQPLPRLHPDQSLDSAMRVLGTYPLLPVSSRTRPYKLIGVLSLDDAHRAYGIKSAEAEPG